jgi:glycine cleavage system H protein
MADIRYTKDHEWIRVEGSVGTVGISDYAQSQLGDVVYVELPEIGKEITKGKEAAVVESVKAASEVYAPVTGEVVAVNDALEGAPATVNEDAEGNGWFLKVKLSNPSELDSLMDADAYKAFLETIGDAVPPPKE